jgi:uncharacterized protein
MGENRDGRQGFAVAVLACATCVIVALIGAHTYKTRNRSNDVVSVTGLAKRDFVSDLVVWEGHFVRRDAELRVAYEALKRDIQAVKQFCTAQGLKEGEVAFSSVAIEKEYEDVRLGNEETIRRFKDYTLTQRLQVESPDVDRIEGFSRQATRLIDSGIEFYSAAPQYYYTKLGELKIEMIAAATKDGRTRGERIAENAGGRIGGLRYSSLGVFQITAPNTSADYSWAGAFDTTSKKKTASVTIKLQFGLR